MNLKTRIELFTRLQHANPHPTTELRYGNTFQLLVAVILSAQATDKSVNQALAPLFKWLLTPADLLDFGQDRFEGAIRTIGLYRTKARNVYATAKILVERHGGKVPDQREALEALPGVGRKTANVILNTAFGQPAIAVDTHIFRVANRTGLARGETPLEVETALMKAVPRPFLQNAHHWLILHGRYVCRARQPDCKHCLLVDLCEFGAKNV